MNVAICLGTDRKKFTTDSFLRAKETYRNNINMLVVFSRWWYIDFLVGKILFTFSRFLHINFIIKEKVLLDAMQPSHL